MASRYIIILLASLVTLGAALKLRGHEGDIENQRKACGFLFGHPPPEDGGPVKRGDGEEKVRLGDILEMCGHYIHELEEYTHYLECQCCEGEECPPEEECPPPCEGADCPDKKRDPPPPCPEGEVCPCPEGEDCPPPVDKKKRVLLQVLQALYGEK